MKYKLVERKTLIDLPYSTFVNCQCCGLDESDLIPSSRLYGGGCYYVNKCKNCFALTNLSAFCYLQITIEEL